jgi:hypothetical protein
MRLQGLSFRPSIVRSLLSNPGLSVRSLLSNPGLSGWDGERPVGAVTESTAAATLPNADHDGGVVGPNVVALHLARGRKGQRVVDN